MAARLKVFCTTNGLTQYAVATTSKAKALEAWGTRQDLFKEGLASESDDPGVVEAALARPGEVVTRSALGGGALEAALAAAPKKNKDRKGKTAEPEKKRGPSEEALRKLAKLEAKVADFEARRDEAYAELTRRRQELEREERRTRERFDRERAELGERLTAARARVKAEGG